MSVGTPVVPMGSAITASCTIHRERCRGLEDGQPHISWLLDSEPMAGRQRRGVGGTEVSELSVPQLNRPQAKLWCCVEWNGTKQRVGMAEIRAGCKCVAVLRAHLLCSDAEQRLLSAGLLWGRHIRAMLPSSSAGCSPQTPLASPPTSAACWTSVTMG